ncbi:MAG: glycosyl hydrolase 115 family protein [Opitutaceae bacterium]
MKKILLPLFCGLLFVVIGPRTAVAATLSVKNAITVASDFPVVVNGRAATIVVDSNDAEVVRLAAGLLATDIETVTGVKPGVINSVSEGNRADRPFVLIGTLDQSALIKDLVQRGKLDAKAIEGKWESFLVTIVADPLPGVARALVIAGSDRRGAAYGVFEMSEAIGVSPWAWWADVTPRKRQALILAAGTHTQGPPSVKFRGIFLNDEDWGLQPWAAKTFEPETGDIGPKTYAKIFELLLRLKANFCWSAMHPSTKPFNSFPENKVVADRYAIVMGSSHAEPMLRNNVGEWPRDQAQKWNPVTNLPAILDYWEQRVRENGRYENVYTMGMRGIHDGAMPGGGTLVEKRARLEKIIDLQRWMLAKHVNPDPSRVPQIFCPYKEVLDIYQTGLTLPDDVTIVCPDDNNGYVRQLPDARERARAGGHGIYYHLSYWGRPYDYLWLDSTPPALVWHELTKTYALGGRQLWVANVGDLKSIETGMTFFLQLAWNVDRFGDDPQRAFLRDFYRQQFGPEHADEIAALRDEYYRLCAIRRPEHMGFNRVYPDTPVQNSDWSPAEAARFLERWRDVERRAKAVGAKLPAAARDAYFELVEYPASGGAAMAEKILLAEKARLGGSPADATAAEAAFQRIQQLTARYNAVGNGKWTGIMNASPRRLPVFAMPPTTPPAAPAPATALTDEMPGLRIDPTKFIQRRDEQGAGWRVVEGLGPQGRALAVLPHRDTPTRLSPAEIREHSPMLEYRVNAAKAGDVQIVIDALPTHRLTPAHEVVAAVSVNDEAPVVVRFDQGIDDEKDATWQRNVLRGAMYGRATLRVPQGSYTLKVWAADCGVVLQQISVNPK